jgi:hypothetical protein
VLLPPPRPHHVSLRPVASAQVISQLPWLAWLLPSLLNVPCAPSSPWTFSLFSLFPRARALWTLFRSHHPPLTNVSLSPLTSDKRLALITLCTATQSGILSSSTTGTTRTLLFWQSGVSRHADFELLILLIFNSTRPTLTPGASVKCQMLVYACSLPHNDCTCAFISIKCQMLVYACSLPHNGPAFCVELYTINSHAEHVDFSCLYDLNHLVCLTNLVLTQNAICPRLYADISWMLRWFPLLTFSSRGSTERSRRGAWTFPQCQSSESPPNT